MSTKHPLANRSTPLKQTGKYNVTTHNRFEVLIDTVGSNNDTIENNSHVGNRNVMQKPHSIPGLVKSTKENKSTFKTVVCSPGGEIKNVENAKVKSGSHHVASKECSMVNVQFETSGTTEGNVKCIDYTDTKFIAKSTLEGKNYVKKVNVQNLNEKCADLQACISQQTNVSGFLPITPLDKVKFATSLKPNMTVSDRILTQSKFTS